MREVWLDSYYWDPDTINNRPYGYPNSSYNWTIQERWYRDSNYDAEFGERHYFQQRYSGFFVPPLDSLYTFNFISDDRLDLYLSPNSSREHKQLIAFTNQWTRNSWNYFPTQMSSPIELKAGQAYYIEALHVEASGTWNIGVGTKIHNLTWTDDIAVADHEEQIIQITSTVIKETQVCIWSH